MNECASSQEPTMIGFLTPTSIHPFLANHAQSSWIPTTNLNHPTLSCHSTAIHHEPFLLGERASQIHHSINSYEPWPKCNLNHESRSPIIRMNSSHGPFGSHSFRRNQAEFSPKSGTPFKNRRSTPIDGNKPGNNNDGNNNNNHYNHVGDEFFRHEFHPWFALTDFWNNMFGEKTSDSSKSIPRPDRVPIKYVKIYGLYDPSAVVKSNAYDSDLDAYSIAENSDWSYQTNTELPPDFVRSLVRSIKDEQVASKKILNYIINSIHNWYDANGYLLATASIIQAPTTKNKGTLKIQVLEPVYAGVELIGLSWSDLQRQKKNGEEQKDELLRQVKTKTSKRKLAKAINLKKGQKFRWDNAWWQRMKDSGLFFQVKADASLKKYEGDDATTEPGRKSVADKVFVNVTVIEKGYISITPSFQTSNEGYVLGEIALQHDNLLGGGERAKLAAQKLVGARKPIMMLELVDPQWLQGSRFERSINLSKNIPPLGLLPAVYQSKDTANITLNGYPFKTFPNWRPKLAVEATEVHGTVEPFAITPRATSSLRQLVSTAELRSDMRLLGDHGLYPTRGHHIKIGADYGLVLVDDRPNFKRYHSSFTKYFSPFGDMLTLVGHVQGSVSAQPLPRHEQVLLGGTHSVRGFEIGELGYNNSHIRGNLEVRAPIGGQFALTGFIDVGQGLDNLRKDPELSRGVSLGVGLRFSNVLQLDLGRTLEGTTKFHVSIANMEF